MTTKLRRLAAVAFLCLSASPSPAATLLPNGEQTFLGANGQPLNGGTVQFFVPNTTTPKDTWKDAGQTVLNTNPITLDSSGRAIIYGAGAYREVLKDAGGNLIWDQLTLDTAASSSSYAGASGGTANAQTVAAPNFTSADGQTISFIASLTNTGPLSILPNGANPIGVLKDTVNGPVLTTGSEVVAGNAYTLKYDASRGAFHLASIPAPTPPTIPAIHYAGQVISMRTQNCPFGTLYENGAVYSPTTFPDLYAAIGTTWGGTPSAPLLPDSRGYVDRGWGGTDAPDPGRVFGTTQQDAVGPHTHTYYQSSNQNSQTVSAGSGFTLNQGGQYSETSQPTPSSGNTAAETRMKNITVVHCIFPSNSP